jgi:hypothetical protein
MKTKKNRRETSKKRQEMARQVGVWRQKIKELEDEMRLEHVFVTEEKILYARVELKRYQDDLRNLGTRQRSWASGRLGV